MRNPPEALKIEFFEGLPENDVSRVLDLATRSTYSDGQVIIAEGEEGDTLFIVASGRVSVEKATIDRKLETLTTLGPGECFGELALVDRQPRSATIRAIGQAEVYRITLADLNALFAQNPEIQCRLLQRLVSITAQRLRLVDETLVQSIYDTIITIDRSFLILQRNQVTKERGLLGRIVAADEAVGKDLFQLVPHLGEGVRRKLLQVMSSREIATLHLDHKEDKGNTVYLEITVAPRLEDGRVVGAVLGIRNVTETKSLEVQLIQAEKLAMAGRMAAEVGHELNNYLAVISGHTDILLSYEDVQKMEPVSKSLKAISGQIRRIERFTAGLMDMGMLQSKTEEANLNPLIEKLIDFIQGQSRFRSIEFVLNLDREIPTLEIDPGQIQQVLLNLYANAADAMGHGQVTTETRLNGNEVIAEVRDDGPGMPEEVRSRIFESGFTTKSTGHGFGLALCQRVVQNHNGSLAVESQPGKGSCFTLTFQV